MVLIVKVKKKLCTNLTKQIFFASAQFVSRNKQSKGQFIGILVRKKHLIEIESTNTHNAYVEYYVKKKSLH